MNRQMNLANDVFFEQRQQFISNCCAMKLTLIQQLYVRVTFNINNHRFVSSDHNLSTLFDIFIFGKKYEPHFLGIYISLKNIHNMGRLYDINTLQYTFFALDQILHSLMEFLIVDFESHSIICTATIMIQMQLFAHNKKMISYSIVINIDGLFVEDGWRMP